MIIFRERMQLLVGSGSTSAFAKKAGIGDSLARKYLDKTAPGVPGLDKALKIAQAFGVTLDWLAGAGESNFICTSAPTTPPPPNQDLAAAITSELVKRGHSKLLAEILTAVSN